MELSQGERADVEKIVGKLRTLVAASDAESGKGKVAIFAELMRLRATLQVQQPGRRAA